MNSNQKEEFRYEFAGMAMQAILSNAKMLESIGYIAQVSKIDAIRQPKGIAVLAVTYADALIAALDKKELNNDN